jgi:class 3 adenylate cyclase/energy-coupling factor transporter ATP-binding protein EcfA2
MSDDVEGRLAAAGLGKYFPAFSENEITLADLPYLTEDDLKEMGLPIGPRRRALRAFAELAAVEHPAPEPRSTTLEASSLTSNAERRQLTVMFCDLVGSTELSNRLDPEDMREIMRLYQDTVAGAITRYGGHVAKYLGDGVLAYFGWPQAYEDQAGRAVHAGLDIVLAVENIDTRSFGGDQLAIRIGIASGAVVVGDLSGENDAIVGDTPNLAARLQAQAEAGQVVVGETTAGLVQHDFTLEAMGERALKGFDRPISPFRAIAVRRSESRFEARHQGRDLDVFVGRQAELALLQQSWQMAQSGEGRIVLLDGEAGIGKSRLMQEFKASIAEDEGDIRSYQCGPYHSNTMLYPFIQQIELKARLSDTRSDVEKLRRLENLLLTRAADLAIAVPLYAELLKIPLDDRYDKPNLTPEQLKTATLSLLISQIAAAAARAPVLILFEDLHWIDPTSLELLNGFIDALHDKRILLVASHRPEWQANFADKNHVTGLTLNRLGDAQARELARAIAGNDVEDRILDAIAERTDGVPVYIEEFTRTVLEAGAADGPAKVPDNLLSSLMARLDRLEEAKHVAQVASVIGREFDRELLSTVLDLPSNSIVAALQRINSAGLVREIESRSSPAYEFKHTFVRDAAYESLLRQDRRVIHRKIADNLSERAGENVNATPEVAAQHYVHAEEWQRALEKWRLAGAGAVDGGALEEAVAHFTHALQALGKLPQNVDRDRVEIEVLLELAPATMMVRGLASREPKEYYDRAYDLARDVGDANQQFIALWGGYYTTEIRAQWKESAPNIESLLALDTSHIESDLPVQIDHAAMTYFSNTGNISAALEHSRRIHDAYDRETHHNHKFMFGAHDPCVCAMNQRGNNLTLMGQFDQAGASLCDSEALAQTLDHPPSLALAYLHGSYSNLLIENYDVARQKAVQTIEHCREHHVWPVMRTAEFYHLASLEDRGEAYAGLSTRIDTMRERNRHGMYIPYLSSLCAMLALEFGNWEHALKTANYSYSAASATGEKLHLGAILHLRGQALSMGGDRDAARRVFQQGREISEKQGALLYQLRNAVGLVELRHEADDKVDLYEILKPILGRFDQNLETPMLQRANRALEQLC